MMDPPTSKQEVSILLIVIQLKHEVFESIHSLSGFAFLFI